MNKWNAEISDLTKFFKEVRLPESAVRLSKVETIIDVPLFIESHMSIVIARNGHERYLPYLDRLLQLKIILENNKPATVSSDSGTDVSTVPDLSF
jgi:hypothetical protein